MASTPNKSKKPRNKPPKGRPAATSAISQPAVEDASSSHAFSSFSPQGDLFAFLSLAVDKHRLRVYDTTTGQSVAEHMVDSARVTSICWAHYDTAAQGDGEPKRKRKRKNQQGDAASIKLPPPGIILGLSNGSLILYSPAHGKVVKSISHSSSTAAITSVAVEHGDDSEVNQAWTSGVDGVVRLWDLREGSLAAQWKSDERTPYSCLSVRPSGAESSEEDVELLGANYSIQLLSASSSADIASETRKLQKVSSFTGHASSVKILEWDNSSRFVSSAEADRFIYLWDVPEASGAEGKVAASIPLDSEVRSLSLDTPSTSQTQTLLAVSASGRIAVFLLPAVSESSSSSNSKSKVPTLTPNSTIVASPSKKGGEAARVQVISAAFVAGVDGKIRVARLAGGVRPVFDVVEYLDIEGGFLPEIRLPPLAAGAALRSEAETANGASTKRYTESGATAVRSGIELGQDATMDELAARDVEGELDADLAELSLGQRLTALTGAPDGPAQRSSDSDDEHGSSKLAQQADGPPLQTVPASSLTRTLIQALHSSDSGLLETCLAHTNASLIQNTVRRLPSQLAVPLVLACVERLGRGKRVGRGKGGGAGAGAQRGTGLVRWIRAALLVHGGHLLTMPDLVVRLSGLHATLTSRLALQQSLLSLSGRLDLVISQIEMRSSAAPAPLPVPQTAKSKGKQKKQAQKQVAKYVEGESSEEEEEEGMEVEVESGDDAGSIEDVELGGSDEDEEDEDSDEEEDEEEDSEEDEEEDEDDDSDVGGLKMNGFIDDEAEEYSDDEDEDESE